MTRKRKTLEQNNIETKETQGSRKFNLFRNPKRSKMGNRWCCVDEILEIYFRDSEGVYRNEDGFEYQEKFGGRKFQSIKEANRYIELFSNPDIEQLQCQVHYRLDVNGNHICKYIADFVYLRDGQEIVEDTKSTFTRKQRVYQIKKKLMKAIHDIDIFEYIPPRKKRKKKNDLL